MHGTISLVAQPERGRDQRGLSVLRCLTPKRECQRLGNSPASPHTRPSRPPAHTHKRVCVCSCKTCSCHAQMTRWLAVSSGLTVHGLGHPPPPTHTCVCVCTCAHALLAHTRTEGIDTRLMASEWHTRGRKKKKASTPGTPHQGRLPRRSSGLQWRTQPMAACVQRPERISGTHALRTLHTALAPPPRNTHRTSPCVHTSRRAGLQAATSAIKCRRAPNGPPTHASSQQMRANACSADAIEAVQTKAHQSKAKQSKAKESKAWTRLRAARNPLSARGQVVYTLAYATRTHTLSARPTRACTSTRNPQRHTHAPRQTSHTHATYVPYRLDALRGGRCTPPSCTSAGQHARCRPGSALCC
jgi:hypothetical protein